MPLFPLTDEQRAVVAHPIGNHARVLAVAGAGKTTTMAHRIQHLVQNEGVQPERIAVLMFNRRARQQFQAKLATLMPPAQQPAVHTFHSYAYTLIQNAMQRRIVQGKFVWWINEHEELVRLTLKRAIQALEKQDLLPTEEVDTDIAGEAISLWKGSLIPPHRAGHRLNRYLPLVYAQFEHLRHEKNALTFDDFVPLAVNILTQGNSLRDEIRAQYSVIIVDEYQDVNYGQQRLIELLANERADIMVVGDDDQTIYEWRGARPQYIIHDFPKIFDDKPTLDYTLSHTFRFGATLAQCAQNVISFNTGRVQKKIIAHDIAKPADIHILHDEDALAVNRELAEQVVALVRDTQNPQEVIVLARMFSQLSGLEVEFINRQIPYRVIGRGAFFERREITALLDYLRLALRLEEAMGDEERELLLSVANIPNRRIKKDTLARLARQAGSRGMSAQDLLLRLTDGVGEYAAFSFYVQDSFAELLLALQHLRKRIQTTPNAGDVIAWLVAHIDYTEHFQDYYGKGEASHDRLVAVQAFIAFARELGKDVPAMLKHVAQMDTTHGQPRNNQIIMTTVYRVKGEEFDYVVVPNCDEGFMPFAYENDNAIYDREGMVSEPAPSAGINNERRLFYVALTRARKAVYIGATLPPKGDQKDTAVPTLSRFIEEMQMQPTAMLTQAIQRTATGNMASRNLLLRELKKHAGHRKIVAMLTHDYLPRMGITPPDELEQALHTTSEVAFKYKHYWPDAHPRDDDKPSKSWWDDLPF
jgi:DNA helicase-2/ATP-dependent DNA helicase PcrA